MVGLVRDTANIMASLLYPQLVPYLPFLSAASLGQLQESLHQQHMLMLHQAQQQPQPQATASVGSNQPAHTPSSHIHTSWLSDPLPPSVDRRALVKDVFGVSLDSDL